MGFKFSFSAGNVKKDGQLGELDMCSVHVLMQNAFCLCFSVLISVTAIHMKY